MTMEDADKRNVTLIDNVYDIMELSVWIPGIFTISLAWAIWALEKNGYTTGDGLMGPLSELHHILD
jgi:hypothetical protein